MTEGKTIEDGREQWWHLSESPDGSLQLSAVGCHSAVYFEIIHTLTRVEVESYRREGRAFLEDLSGRMSADPNKYNDAGQIIRG